MPRPTPPSLASLAAMVFPTSVAIVMLNASPLVELALTHDTGLTVSEVGVLYFAELAWMALAALPAYGWPGGFNSRRTTQAAYLVFAAGNLLSPAGLDSFGWLLLARMVAGAGAGTLMVLGLRAAALSPNPPMAFALVTLGQLISGAFVLHGFPALTAGGPGLGSLFHLCALLGVAGFLAARPGPAEDPAPALPAIRPGAKPAGRRGRFLAIAFAASFNLVVGGLWAFVGEYGAAVALAPTDVSAILGWATAFGCAGVVLTGYTGGACSHRAALSLGFAALALGAALLHLVHRAAGFTAGCLLFSLAWNFCVPHVLAAVSATDRDGRAMASMGLAFPMGLALGPLLAGELIGAGGLGTLVPAAWAGLAMSVLLMTRVTGPQSTSAPPST